MASVPVIPGLEGAQGQRTVAPGRVLHGLGFADMYTGLSGGVTFPALADYPTGYRLPPAFAADIDNGIVTYDSKGGLHGIHWTMYLLGAQYYLPGMDGKVWVSGNYSHTELGQYPLYGTAAKLRAAEDWFDVNLFVDSVPSVRVGAEYANFIDMYVDGQHAMNHRVQLSGFFIF